MKVIVVGCGIAGLTAAIALRKAGHRVYVFERTGTATAFGAGVVLGYNCSYILAKLGLEFARWGINIAGPSKMLNGASLEEVAVIGNKEYSEVSRAQQYYAHRVDLQQAFLELATQNEGQGHPVEVVYNAYVVSYGAEEGRITLENGATHTADLIVAADGVHSLAPQYVLDDPPALRHAGTTIVRFMLPSAAMKSDPQTAPLLNEGQFTLYIHPDRQRYLLQYPVRDNQEQNFGLYSINPTGADVDSQIFRFQCDRDSLARELDGFHDRILVLAPKTKDILPVWKLHDRNPLDRWWKEKLMLIGDAAHPMLPNQGQGAGMSIEDAGALGEVFTDMPNASKEEISNRLSGFESVRKPRASVVQLLSRVPYYEKAVEMMMPDLLEQLPKEKLPEASGAKDIRRWLFRYNVLEDTRKFRQSHLGGRL